MPVSLGLDLDGVVADYGRAFQAFVAKARGVDEASLPPQNSWSYVDNGWFSSDAEYLQMHADAVRAGIFLTMPAIEGASESLWRLSDAGIHIRVITHRLFVKGVHSSAAGDTVAFLENHHIPYRDLCFVSNKVGVDADIYLDDAPHNLCALRAAGRYAITFDQTYNRGLAGPRAHGWGEAAELILARQDEMLGLAAAS